MKAKYKEFGICLVCCKKPCDCAPKATREEVWKECPECGGMSFDMTNTELGQGLKDVLENGEIIPPAPKANEAREWNFLRTFCNNGTTHRFWVDGNPPECLTCHKTKEQLVTKI